MSGCDKSLSHGRSVNAVAKDTGSEAPHSLTSNTSALAPSNTPAPTPEPSKSALPASADTGSSVKKYAVNAVLCVVALAVIVGCYDAFRYFKPKEVIIPAPEFSGDKKMCLYETYNRGLGLCRLRHKNSTSYTWYFAKQRIKRYFFADATNGNEIDRETPVYKLHSKYYRYLLYGYELFT
jgi:hypothetical protein